MLKAIDLFNELSENYKPNKKRPELGEFCELKCFYDKGLLLFSIGWYDIFEVQFNPKTIKVKHTKINRQTKEHITKIKQIPLSIDNLLDKILECYEV